MLRLRRSTVVMALVLAAVLASATTAYAYFTASGSGTGTATVAAIKPLTITQVAVTGLLPGIAQNLKVTVSNSNAFSVSIAKQVLSVTPSVDNPRCVFSKNFELVPPTIHETSVPPHGSVEFRAGSIKLINLPTQDQGVCQGATVTLRYTLAF